jgi:hypothetical protein
MAKELTPLSSSDMETVSIADAPIALLSIDVEGVIEQPAGYTPEPDTVAQAARGGDFPFISLKELLSDEYEIVPLQETPSSEEELVLHAHLTKYAIDDKNDREDDDEGLPEIPRFTETLSDEHLFEFETVEDSLATVIDPETANIDLSFEGSMSPFPFPFPSVGFAPAAIDLRRYTRERPASATPVGLEQPPMMRKAHSADVCSPIPMAGPVDGTRAHLRPIHSDHVIDARHANGRIVYRSPVTYTPRVTPPPAVHGQRIAHMHGPPPPMPMRHGPMTAAMMHSPVAHTPTGAPAQAPPAYILERVLISPTIHPDGTVTPARTVWVQRAAPLPTLSSGSTSPVSPDGTPRHVHINGQVHLAAALPQKLIEQLAQPLPRRKRSLGSEAMASTKKRRRPKGTGKPPQDYYCHRCGKQAEHWVDDCHLPKIPGPPPPHYVCHRCHCKGHWIEDCREFWAQHVAYRPPPPTYICHICLSPGHWIDHCPNRRSSGASTPRVSHGPPRSPVHTHEHPRYGRVQSRGHARPVHHMHTARDMA